MSNVIIDWQKIFAWKPIRVRNEIFWLQSIYRRKISHWTTYDRDPEEKICPPWQGIELTEEYEYGTILDVLKTKF